MSRRPRTRFVKTLVPPVIPLPRSAARGVVPDCPHCGSELAWLTREEFDQHCAVFDVRTRPDLAGVSTLPGTQYPWWFCHDCRNGGALVAT